MSPEWAEEKYAAVAKRTDKQKDIMIVSLMKVIQEQGFDMSAIKMERVKMVTRADILAYAKENYNTDPERLWAKYPEYEVLRHRNNKKWYVILMDVPGNKVGLETDEVLDIIDIKCEPDMILTLSTQTGFAPAYHMNKKHWLTILLNGSVNDDEIYNLLDMSYEMTK